MLQLLIHELVSATAGITTEVTSSGDTAFPRAADVNELL